MNLLLFDIRKSPQILSGRWITRKSANDRLIEAFAGRSVGRPGWQARDRLLPSREAADLCRYPLELDDPADAVRVRADSCGVDASLALGSPW